MKMMNRKGDVPLIIMVVVTLALIVTLLFVFLTFKDSLNARSSEYSKLSSGLEFNYQYVVSTAKVIVKETYTSDDPAVMDLDYKDRVIAIADKYDYNIKGEGNFFGKIRNGDFEFDGDNFKVSDLFVTSEFKANNAKRVFDLCLEFDAVGNFKNYC